MKGLMSEPAYAFEAYPVEERLLLGFEGGVLLVDVGGGLGQDI